MLNFIQRAALVLLSLWYVGACAVHYAYQRPLWNDELAVYDSIRDFKPHQFFSQPLQTVQVFPRFYLFVIQSFAGLFNDSILSLRFFSFVCMLGAFAVWLQIARRELKGPWEYLTFVLCWIASVPLIYYSAELKQYSMDVLLSGIFVWFLYEQERIRSAGSGRYMLILGLLPLAVFFSYPAYFFLIVPLWNLWLSFKTDRSQGKYIGVYLLSLGVCLTLSYLFDVRQRPVEIVTVGFNDYFIATDSLSSFFQTLGEGINNLFSRWFVELPKVLRKIARVFMVFGFVYLFAGFFKNIKLNQWRLNRVPVIALVVFLQFALAGALKKYPFGVPRTALFLCPMLLILTVQGICSVKQINRPIYFFLHIAFTVYLITVAVGILGLVLTGPLIAIPEIFKS